MYFCICTIRTSCQLLWCCLDLNLPCLFPFPFLSRSFRALFLTYGRPSQGHPFMICDGFWIGFAPVLSCSVQTQWLCFGIIPCFSFCLVAFSYREGVMEFLLVNHPLDCPICDQGGECDLQVLFLFLTRCWMYGESAFLHVLGMIKPSA